MTHVSCFIFVVILIYQILGMFLTNPRIYSIRNIHKYPPITFLIYYLIGGKSYLKKSTWPEMAENIFCVITFCWFDEIWMSKFFIWKKLKILSRIMLISSSFDMELSLIVLRSSSSRVLLTFLTLELPLVLIVWL